MNTVLVFSCLFLSMSCALIIRENVAFRKTNEISLSRSMWTVTLVLDLKPYHKLLDTSFKNLRDIRQIFENRKRNFVLDKTHTFFQTLERQLDLLSSNRQKIVDSFSQLQIFQFRSKRSLFPFLGDIIGFIAGTPTETDINTIRNNIKTLSENQGKVQHVVNQSLSLINMTHHRVVENRKRINKISNAVNGIVDTLNKVKKELHINLNYREFLDFYLQLNSVINSAGELITELNFYMEELQLQLNMLSLGKISPITIKPEKLRNTLLAIKEKLPENLRLPFNPKSEIWEYYRMLTSSVIFDNDRILVIINVPLINRGTQFEVYKVYNMPIPNVAISKHRSKDISLKRKHLVASYKLEAKAIAVNQQRTNFVIMSDEEAKLCSNHLTSFCEFKSPVYPVNRNKFCLIALFNGSQKKIKQLCQARVYINDILPNA